MPLVPKRKVKAENTEETEEKEKTQKKEKERVLTYLGSRSQGVTGREAAALASALAPFLLRRVISGRAWIFLVEVVPRIVLRKVLRMAMEQDAQDGGEIK